MKVVGGALSLRCVALCALAMAGACAGQGAPPAFATPDEERFATEAYPVLLRDCAMSECHGSMGRFLRVVGPGRERLSASTDPLAPATDDELRLSYDRARSMLGAEADRARSLLLRKPLERAAGGVSHGGADRLGRNVYASARDAGYRALARWAESQGESEPSP